MPRTIKHRLKAGATLLLFIAAACSDENDGPRDKRSAKDDDGFEGIVGLSEMPLLAAGCTIVTTGTAPVMTVTVKDGESALISLRTTDNMVTVNGHVFMGTTDTNLPCDIAPNGTISVLADQASAGHMYGRSVIVDYINGLFMLGVGTVPGIKVDFTTAGDTGVLNRLMVRGSDGNDQFAVGAGTGIGAMAIYAFNANAKTGTATMQTTGTGGGTVTLDAIADVTFKMTPQVVITTGAGDDRLDASGGNAMSGVGMAFPSTVKLFGGDGADTLVGGLGADTLSGGANADVLNGCQGDDTYDMGSAAQGADVIAQACTATLLLEGNDTVDYSKRTNPITVNLSRTLTAMNSATDTALSGEGALGATDGAHISDKVVNIKLGQGNDTMVVAAASTIAHKIFGGTGDDSFTGGAAADSFDGEAGDDTCIGTTSAMSYAARTAAVTVSICGGMGVTCNTTTDATDGDGSLTGSTHTGTGASTTLTGGNPIATVTATGFTQLSVGQNLTLSNCGGVTADEAAFPIVAVSADGTTAKIDTTAAATFALATCDWSEARPGTTARTGLAAAVSNDVVTGTVATLNGAASARWVGHKITLMNSAATTGGATTDNGTFDVVGFIDVDSVAIDHSNVVGFAGAVDALNWSEAGPEHDNVQCASVIGGGGADLITGDSRPNNIRGGNGGDTLNGGAGSDTLTGEGGTDNLYGGAGDDTLIGGGGNSISTGSAPNSDLLDNLFGGDGNDLLEGDTGVDVFACDGLNSNTSLTAGTSPGEADIMVDFTRPSGDSGGADCEF